MLVVGFELLLLERQWITEPGIIRRLNISRDQGALVNEDNLFYIPGAVDD